MNSTLLLPLLIVLILTILVSWIWYLEEKNGWLAISFGIFFSACAISVAYWASIATQDPFWAAIAEAHLPLQVLYLYGTTLVITAAILAPLSTILAFLIFTTIDGITYCQETYAKYQSRQSRSSSQSLATATD